MMTFRNHFEIKTIDGADWQRVERQPKVGHLKPQENTEPRVHLIPISCLAMDYVAKRLFDKLYADRSRYAVGPSHVGIPGLYWEEKAQRWMPALRMMMSTNELTEMIPALQEILGDLFI